MHSADYFPARVKAQYFSDCQSSVWQRNGNSRVFDEDSGHQIGGCNVAGRLTITFKRIGSFVYGRGIGPYTGLDTGWQIVPFSFVEAGINHSIGNYTGNIYGDYSSSYGSWACFAYIP